MAKKKEASTKEQQTVEPVFTVDEARAILHVLDAFSTMLGEARDELALTLGEEK